MALEKNAYFTLPIREKINLFLQISDRNQVLTDLSGVNNNKISKLKRDPSLINNIQLVNVERLEEAFNECVRREYITFENTFHVFTGYIPKDELIAQLMQKITHFKLEGKRAVPWSDKQFAYKYKGNLNHGMRPEKPHYRLRVYNRVISDIYIYRMIFVIKVDDWDIETNENLHVNIDMELRKIPKNLR